MAIAFPGSSLAEDSDTLLTVRIITVEGGKTNEFVDLQRQLMEARKEAGSPGRWVWQEVRGNSSTYHIVTASSDFATLDETNEPVMGETAWATWINRVGQTIQSREVVNVRLYPELEIEAKEGQMGNLLLLTHRTIAQGRNNDYLDWYEKKIIPIMKKNGVSGRSIGRTIYGGDTRVITSVRYLSSYAELDEPGLLASLSDKERENVLADIAGMVVEVENTLLRYREDMSHDGP